MSKNYTCLLGLHHMTSEEMYVLEWKKRNGNQIQPTLYMTRFQQREIWKYFNGDTTYEFGQAPETTKHMLQCPLLAHACTLDDHLMFNENARKYVDKWKNTV